MLGSTDVPAGSSLTQSRLDIYRDLLVKWNRVINLIGRGSISELSDRHFSDSGQIFDLAPLSASNWVDLGSGAGFPGLVVAVMAAEVAPDVRVTLVEADQRKAEFLRAVSRETGVSVDVICGRIEDVPPLGAEVISARALAPLANLCGYSARHGTQDSVSLFMKGRQYQDELADARRRWNFDVETIPSLTSPDATILRMRNIVHV